MKPARYGLLLSGIMAVVAFAQESDFERFRQQNQQGFEEYQEAEDAYLEEISRQYEDYLRREQEAFEEFRAEVERKWDEFRYQTSKRYVEYDEDLTRRGIVDFEQGVVEVEVITTGDSTADSSEIKARIGQQIEGLVNTTDFQNRSILLNQLEMSDGRTVNRLNAAEYAKGVVNRREIQTKTYVAQDGIRRTKHSVALAMVPDHLARRAEAFREDVLRESNRFEIDPRVTFAVMHTESSYNPRARSHIPAYGLMQLVPNSGARDAYIYVYNKDTLLTGDYLFVPPHNIELGCAYLSKIRNRYFRGIKNDTSAYYCAIAAYNTGPGNVARAITGSYGIRSAIRTINEQSSDWVYNKLINDLPFAETRNYLRKVTDRMRLYDSWI